MSLFCPKCGSIMMPKKDAPGTLACSCGYSAKGEARISEKLNKKNTVDVVVEKEDVLPKTAAECSKCGNNEAYYWLVQTRSGDEPETKFLRCTKCEHTWRDYS